MSSKKLYLLFLCSCVLLNACAAPTPQPTNMPLPDPTALPSPTSTPQPRPFRVIGYATDAMIVEVIPYSQLTHINFAFLIPNADGTFAPLNNTSRIKLLVQNSHQNGVQVLISIGGWGWDAQFEEIAASPSKRAVFISEALKVLAEYGFDGVDIDWEYPDPGASAKNYLALMRELRAALPGKLLTTAVISYGDETGLGISSEVFDLLDFLNVMTYDGPDHATLKQFQTGLDYWLGRGVPPEKLVMGLPFYSRPGEVPFRKLIQADPQAGKKDVYTYNGRIEHYNSYASVQKKTLLALDNASGIMFWTLEQDAQGEPSLLNTIHNTIESHKP